MNFMYFKMYYFFILFLLLVFSMVELFLDDSPYKTDQNNEGTTIQPELLKVIFKDIKILQTSLPAGIWVKSFENRLVIFIYI